MKNQRLKYVSTCVALQEVPDEISLIINVSGCPHKCEGCHSQYLWEYKGNYLIDDLEQILDERGQYISCVCLMGGDYNIMELNQALDFIETRGYKTCVYLGCNYIPPKLHTVNYLKIGSYKKNLGGLDKLTTNQRFYKNIDGQYVDITYVFQTKERLYAEDHKKSQ